MTDERTHVGRFVGNAAPLAVSQVAVSLLLLLNTILLARILGVEQYGLLAIGIALYGLTAFLSDAGLGMWGLRVIDDHPDRWHTVLELTTARLITVTLALGVALLAIAVLPLPDGAAGPAFVMVLTMVPAGFAVEWALIGLERTGRAAIGRVTSAAGMVVLCPALAIVAGPAGAAAGYVAASAAGCVVSWMMLIAAIGGPHRVRPHGVLDTLRHSLPMGASAVLGQVYWQSDSLLAGVLLGSVAAGLYAAPMRLLAAVVGMGWVIGTSLLPVYRAIDGRQDGAVDRLMSNTTRLLILACVPAAGALAGGSAVIVTTLFGQAFAGSAPVLAVGVLTVTVWICIVPLGYTILARRHDHRYLAGSGTAVLVSIPAILVLAPAHGIVGIAVAMLGAELVAAAVIVVGASRTGVALPIRMIAGTIPIAAAVAAVAGLAASASPVGIVGVVAVAVAAEIPVAVVAAPGVAPYVRARARHRGLGG